MRLALAAILLLCLSSALADKTLGSACGHLVSALNPSVKHTSDLVSICTRAQDRAIQAACLNWTAADASMILNFARFENVQMADIICPIFAALPPRAQHLLGGCSWLEKAGCAVAIAGAVTGCGGPEDFPCVIAALGVATGCIQCFCSTIGCPDHCPC